MMLLPGGEFTLGSGQGNPDDYIVGLRMSVAEDAEGGLGHEDAIAIGQRLASSGLIDFISLTGGSATTDFELARQIAPLSFIDSIRSLPAIS